MRYRKRFQPEAVQFDPLGVHRHALPDGVVGVPSPGADNWAYEGCEFYIVTLEGRHQIRPGYWILTGPHGERYGCDPVIFAETYEPAE